MVVAVDACRVAVGEAELDGVVPHLCGGLSAWLGLEHGQRGRWLECRSQLGERGLLFPCVVTGGARTLLAQISELVVAGMPVGPGDVHTRAARNVDLDARWFFSWVEGGRHGWVRDQLLDLPAQQSPGGDRKSTRLNSSHEWISYAVF